MRVLMSTLLQLSVLLPSFLFFFFNDTATTEIYTLSLHDALPISQMAHVGLGHEIVRVQERLVLVDHQHRRRHDLVDGDRKSTRLNSSHGYISYAVFCLKKKTQKHRR